MERTFGRRRFLQDSTAMLGAGTMLSTPSGTTPQTENSTPFTNDLRLRAKFDPGQSAWICVPTDADFKAKLAARELARGLRNLGLTSEPIQVAVGSASAAALDAVFRLEVQTQTFKHPEAYEIARETGSDGPPHVRLRGTTSQAVLYAVFDFLERQGAFFGLDGEIYPLEPAGALRLPANDHPWQGQPRFAVRGLVPWPDFLNCITVFNREDLRAYLEAMLRMRFNEFLVAYAESWSLAFRLHQLLQRAGELKKQGNGDEARQLVARQGVPIWLKLAPPVREAILDFQEIVSTRNDLGTLASMHNKYERLALFRLRASMKEFLGELPAETEKMFEEIRRPESNAAPRVFVPTRPTILGAGEGVRVRAVAPGGRAVTRISLFSRTGGAATWRAGGMKLLGGRTFEAEIDAAPALSPLLDYYVQAEFTSGATKLLVTAPLGAPSRYYTVTLV